MNKSSKEFVSIPLEKMGISKKEFELFLEEFTLNLDEIHVTVSENVKLEISSRKQTISAWMQIYKDAKTSEEKKNLREVAERIHLLQFCHDREFSKHGTFSSKFELSSPYNFFLTTVDLLQETMKEPYSVSFHEIIDYTGGEIVDSLHINYEVNLFWLVTEYMLAAQNPKMTLMYGILHSSLYCKHIPFDTTIVKVEAHESGCHHAKISILNYKNNSIRIIVSSANLNPRDWQQWTQGLWISPILPPLPKNALDSDGESITHFKKDFISYLNAYDQTEMNEWKSLIRRIDFSAVKVFFIASVPGYHEGLNMNLWGHKRLYRILEKHATLPNNARDWPVIAQSSSVGIFGQHYHSWMSTHIVHPMAKEKNKRIIHLPQFRFQYPTQETFDNSFDNELEMTAMRYYEEQHLKQKWMDNHLYQWTFEKTGRTKAMPHCKCYARISPDETQMAWFIITSANLSKAAWGKMIKGETCHAIKNHEAGVIFIPEIMINQTTFPLKESSDLRVPVFLLPYDLPLRAYEPGIKVALLPGDRIFGPQRNEKVEEKSAINVEAKKEEDGKFFNDGIDKDELETSSQP